MYFFRKCIFIFLKIKVIFKTKSAKSQFHKLKKIISRIVLQICLK